MSIGPMGIVGSLAGGQLAQAKGSDTDRAQQATAAQARQSKSAEQAESAAGIGQTTEDAETSDRDANGQRLWESDEESNGAENDPASVGVPHPPQARDPDGNCGANLDLNG